MKITFPHMGNLYIAIEALLSELKFDSIIPPPSSKRTLTLGTKYSPETICLPPNLVSCIFGRHRVGADTVDSIRALPAGYCAPAAGNTL